MDFCSTWRASGASGAGCACTLPDCCASGAAAIPVTLSTGALFAARRSDSLDACGASEPVSPCAPVPCQRGFVMAGINMISTTMHEATIASQLIKVSREYPRRCGCGSDTAWGSYSRRGTSFSKPPPEERNLDVSPACEGDIGGEAVRSCEAAGMRGSSRNFFGAYI